MNADEARARRMGWVPEAEWEQSRAAAKGSPKPMRFLSAADFLGKVESDLPILRERNRFLDERLKEAESQIGELNELVIRLHEQNRAAVIRAVERERLRAEAMMDLDEANAEETGEPNGHSVYDDLSDEEKADCERFCRYIPDCTPQDYIDLYRPR